MPTFGRDPIYTAFEAVDASNILKVLDDALASFRMQRVEIEHLFDVYRGKQRVLGRQKRVRPEINNRIVRNHANEIVSFKVSYLLSEPVKYVCRSATDVTDGIVKLNDFMFMESKDTKDKEIADHFNICGVAYRMVLPNLMYSATDADAVPFHVYTLDPRDTFVIRYSGLGHRILCGVHLVRKSDEKGIVRETACVYTDNTYYEIDYTSGVILAQKINPLGCVPVFEYINNEARLGSFEIVETLLDAINALESNWLDGTEQAVQSLLKFKNCDIDDAGFEQMREKGAVIIKAANGVDADISAISTSLNQADQQILMDTSPRATTRSWPWRRQPPSPTAIRRACSRP